MKLPFRLLETCCEGGGVPDVSGESGKLWALEGNAGFVELILGVAVLSLFFWIAADPLSFQGALRSVSTCFYRHSPSGWIIVEGARRSCRRVGL